MDLIKKRWLILITSCIVALSIGALYAWSAFATPMKLYLEELTGHEIASLTIVFTIANAVGPVTMISGGFINDKIGPKWVLVIGGLLFGGGMIGCGFCTSVSGLILAYGGGVGLGLGLIYGVIVSNTVKFFPDRSGFAGGLITACYGGSSIIIPIAANALYQAYGITMAFKIIGAVILIVVISSSFIIQRCPADFSVERTDAQVSSSPSVSREFNYRQMLATPLFYLMLITMTCGAFSGMMIISQASSLSQELMGLTMERAAIVVSFIALFNMLGRIVSGIISDKIGIVNTMKIVFILLILANLCLTFASVDTRILFYGGIAGVGFSFGSIMGIYPSFTAKQFGRRNNSVNYGIMFIGFAVAGLIGPMAMNNIHTMTGAYQMAFIVAAAFAVTGGLLTLVLNKIAR